MKPKEKYEQSFEYSLGTQLKSWYSLNPSFGCFWDCAYCIQHKDQYYNESDYKKINKVFEWEDVVQEVMSNPRITSKTPLTFYNFSDPFLPQNTTDLRSILLELENRNFKNPVGLITRTFVDKETLNTISNLKSLKPVVFVSYAGYTNPNIEKAPSHLRIRLMKELKNRGIPTVLYLRPLVQEWMEKDQMKRVYEETKDSIDSVVMSGIRMTPEIISKVKDKGLVVPYTKNYIHKFFPESLDKEVVDTFKDVPVFRYTSCGVSAILGIPDYNSHNGYFVYKGKGKDDKCELPCTKSQREICSCATDKIDESVLPVAKSLLSKIGYNDINICLENKALILDKEISQFDTTYLRHNLSIHVDVREGAERV